MAITLLDGILIVIMLISALLAMIRGFSREVLSIVSWGAAAAAAFYFHKALSPIIMENVPVVTNSLVADGIAAIIIFLVVLIVVSYLTMLIADMIIDSRIGVLDRTLGFIFGAARGALLVIAALMGFLWLANDQEPEWVANAKSKPMLVAIGSEIRDALPEDLDKVLKNLLNRDGDKNEEGEQDVESKA